VSMTDHKQINFRIDDDLRDRIVAYCSETGVPQSVLFRKALVEYLDEQEDLMERRRSRRMKRAALAK